MKRRDFLKAGAIGVLASLVPGCMENAHRGPAKEPNIVFIMADDMGYGDLGCYGATDIDTSHIDSIRNQGMKFTDFHVHPRCSPSRAALLTGCYANRVGLNRVIYLDDKWGVNKNEVLIPELLKRQGYRTGMVGKWHLGEWEPFWPGNHGFDYSLFKASAVDTEKLEKDGYDFFESGRKKYPSKHVYYKNGKLQNRRSQNVTDTELYTAGAVEFINENKDKPFFLYFAHFLPHIPLRPSARFKGKSGRGLYGDCVEEMDFSVGQVLKTIDELNLTKNTLIIFCSDNGPQLKALNAESGGKSGPLRDGKWTTFEGGTRTPFVARWPRKIKPGSESHDLIGIIDMLPTFCGLAGAKVPDDRVIDGVDISSCMFGRSGGNPPRETFAYFDGGGLFAFRYKKWKLFIREEASKGTNAKVLRNKKVAAGVLFDLENDLAETKDVSSDYPEVVANIKSMADKFLSDFEKNKRPPGRMK